ncbi:MAG TPA: flagellar basal-body rod protein FlgF, partial [Polyangiales bacterium]|nr:flagellar basal-body rod protein FlgF [Polyangiales bacterium]
SNMADGIYTALSGSIAQQHQLDTIANNVANASTAGFRGDRAVFGELVAGAQKGQQRIDPRQPAPKEDNKFVRVDMNQLDMQAGVLRSTGNQLDLALEGDGFFVVRTPQGDRLTRSGNFMLTQNGELSTTDGNLVVGDSNLPIIIPPNTKNIEIRPDGTVRADNTDVARLALKTVKDPNALMREGATTYTVQAGTQVEQAQRVGVIQGQLESSNVNPVNGLNELITVNRTFDALQRVIQSFQEIDQRTARDVGSRSG